MRASHLFKPSLHCVYGSLALAACTLALSIHEPMAAAVVQSTQANETGTDPGPVPVARKVDGTGTIIPPTYASTSTLVQVVTAPTQTITEFFDGLGSSGSSLSTQVSTAGTAPTPTATCSIPAQIMDPCILSEGGACVQKYYEKLQDCYSAGSLETAVNLPSYFIACSKALADGSSREDFTRCALESVEAQVNQTGSVTKRSLLVDGFQRRSAFFDTHKF